MERLIIIFLSILIFNSVIFADELTDGIDDYNRGEYRSAIVKIEDFLKKGNTDREDTLRARAYIGASNFILGNHSIATGWFLSILKEDENYELSPVYFPPEIISFYNEVKNSVKPLVFKKEQRRFYLNFFPFGAGQFQNREYIKGALLAGVEVIALTINLDTYFRRKAMEENGKYPEIRLSEAKRLQDIQIISGGIFIAGYIYGMIDGTLNYKKNYLSFSILNQDGIVSLSYRF